MRIAKTSLGALLAVTTCGSALAEDAAGHWIGKVTTPGAELTITAHLKPAAAGGYEGYAESPDQTIDPIPMTDVKATADTLAFATPSVSAAFEGRWDAAAKGWVGVLKQNGLDMPLTLVRGAPPPRPVVAGLDGEWAGVIQASQGDLHILLHVKTGADGTLVLFESPDQSPMKLVGFPARTGDAVTVELKGIGGFSGKLSADGKVLDGEWRQRGGSIPLILKKAG